MRFKKIYNNTYAYKVWKVKDEKGKWRQHSEYLGVVTNLETKTFEKKSKLLENMILDYGDSYLIGNIIEQLPIFDTLKTIFGNLFDTLMTLIFHRITGGLAMCYAEDWYNGNYVNRLFPNANVSSQNISKFLSYLGKESVQRDFFKSYIPLIYKGKSNIVIDSTGLPNEINMPITDWGYHNGGIAFETRLILAIDRENELPLYFRYVAGNIGDVGTLLNTIKEMKNNGISTSSTLIDAGYYSESNLKMLFKEKISFLIRMPSSRILYKNIITENMDIESSKYAIKYDKRVLFVKEIPVSLYDEKAFAYLVLDSERRGREISKAIFQTDEKEINVKEIDFSDCGKMILLSSEKLNTNEVVPLYYTRQIAERMFCITKDDLNILPLRTHSEPNFKGFMLLIFISLIISCIVKSKLGKEISIEQAVSVLRTLKCKVYVDSIVPSEVTKKQRLIFEKANVLVPKIGGI